jgi:hypothetical protein
VAEWFGHFRVRFGTKQFVPHPAQPRFQGLNSSIFAKKC